MRKIIYIFFLLTAIYGCSGIRKAGKTGDKGKGNSQKIEFTELKKQNLSNENFYIQKAVVEFNSGNIGMSFVTTIKYIVPDEYLISLRMRSGIEMARIYLNSDTIMANDRINRILYYGKPSFLSLKYGVPIELLPVIFGDFVSDNIVSPEVINCKEGSSNINTYTKGIRLNYMINCENKKPVNLRQEGFSGVTSQIEYEEFEKIKNTAFPSSINIMHNESGSTVNLKIEKVETQWDGIIEFVPGNRYERIELK